MSVVNLYFSTRSSMNYVFSDGVVAHFINGQYFTDNLKRIAELNAEVEAKNPNIYVKQDQLKIEEALLNPVTALREKLRAELIMEMSQAKDVGNLGDTEVPPSGVTSSANLIATAAKSTSTVKIGPIVSK